MGRAGEGNVTHDLRTDASDSGNGKRKGRKEAISIGLTKTARRVGEHGWRAKSWKEQLRGT
jgi:hypothetical protein